jgi:hypothetical protein
MTQRPRSLKHEFELYVEREIENYKESVPRRVILGIGDEAVQALAASQQLALTEILLCAEVDRIIRARLRLPSYATWRKRRLKALAEFVKPERWGMRSDSALARTAHVAHEGHVLLAGTQEEGPALYLAANGCEVTALDPTEEMLERVINAAAQVGLTGRIRGLTIDLASWAPDIPLDAVVCAASALSGLSAEQRERAIQLLQNATTAGGVHVVETGADGERLVPLEELEAFYDGWQISVEASASRMETFTARKAAVA